MCGIAGLIHYREGANRADPELLARMAARMAHRGPDGEGFHLDGPCGLAHRRLSIIDLATGAQPMANEDGTVWIVFNGEIYNYKALTRELVSRGHVFRTRSDTETIIHAYEAWGPSAVERLQGMFAFAIWDRSRGELFLARDRVGIKPLYYYDSGATLYFASEVHPLLEVRELRRAVDPEAARQFLAFGFVPAPRTGLADVQKLRPAHFLRVGVDAPPSVERFWHRPLHPTERSPRRAAEALEACLDRTVASHLQSDVPVGLLLSGGIDSAAILAYAARQMRRPVETFSIAFDPGSYYDERAYAQLAAGRFGAAHHNLVLGPDRFVELLPEFARHMEEPVAEAAAIPLLELAHVIRRNVTVVLAGEGADENLAGYEIYRYMLALEALHRGPSRLLEAGAAALDWLGLRKAARYLRLAALPLERRYLGVGLPLANDLDRLLLPGVGSEALAAAEAVIAPIYAETAGAHPIERMLALDFELWLPDDILLKADKMTMAASLELRVPFLDHELVELCASFVARIVVNEREGKLPLRRAVRSLVPRPILRRPKRGFPTPIEAMFRGPLGEFAAGALRASSGHGLWEPGAVARALERHRRGEASLHRPLWLLLVFELWARALTAAPTEVAPPRPTARAAGTPSPRS